MNDRLTVDTITSDALDALYAERDEHKQDYLNACKTIAAMHKAAVGEVRGPARGVVEDVEDVRLRADQAEDLLRVAHDTSNRSEGERARAVQRAEQAEAAIARVRAEANVIERGVLGDHDAAIVCRAAANRIRAALDEPGPATAQAVEPCAQGCGATSQCPLHAQRP